MLLKVGIVGLGHIARYHIGAISERDDMQIIAVCDQNAAAYKEGAEMYPFFTSIDQLLAYDRPDVLIIATPNKTHYSLVRQALQSGCHVIVEKPSAGTVAEIDELEKIAIEHKRILYHAFHAAFGKEVNWWCSQGSVRDAYGPVAGFACGFYDPYFDNGCLEKSARALENSWADSAVNALSVLNRFIPLSHIRLLEKKTTVIEGVAVQSHASYVYIGEEGCHGLGAIDTNWMLGLNEKKTYLFYGQTQKSILLDHTKQQVAEIDGETKRILADFSDDGERLLNHYRNVFSDFMSLYGLGINNKECGKLIHSVLFSSQRHQ